MKTIINKIAKAVFSEFEWIAKTMAILNIVSLVAFIATVAMRLCGFNVPRRLLIGTFGALQGTIVASTIFVLFGAWGCYMACTAMMNEKENEKE